MVVLGITEVMVVVIIIPIAQVTPVLIVSHIDLKVENGL